MSNLEGSSRVSRSRFEKPFGIRRFHSWEEEHNLYVTYKNNATSLIDTIPAAIVLFSPMTIGVTAMIVGSKRLVTKLQEIEKCKYCTWCV